MNVKAYIQIDNYALAHLCFTHISDENLLLTEHSQSRLPAQNNSKGNLKKKQGKTFLVFFFLDF
jgi:hypothetical protein